MPVVSPSNTAIGLTRRGAGAEPGEPDKYYPTGERTYLRIMPNDAVQAAALATAMRDAGCRRIAAVHDGEVYGKGVGTLMRRTVTRLGMKVAGTTRIKRSTRRFGAIRATVSPIPASPPTAPFACSTASAAGPSSSPPTEWPNPASRAASARRPRST